MTDSQTISKEGAENIDAADAEQRSEPTAPEDGVTELRATGYLTNYSLDRFVSQDLSRLTECNAPDIAGRFPQSSHWIANFVLNSMFGNPVSDEARKFCLAFLRRAEAAFFNYGLARESLIEVAESVRGEGPAKASLYFRALHLFEVCLAMEWQAISLFARLTPDKPFKKGDGSDYEKLNRIYNASKHYDPASLPPGLVHAVWITNDGINIDGVCLSFTELEELMIELGQIADHASSCAFRKPTGENKETS